MVVKISPGPKFSHRPTTMSFAFLLSGGPVLNLDHLWADYSFAAPARPNRSSSSSTRITTSIHPLTTSRTSIPVHLQHQNSPHPLPRSRTQTSFVSHEFTNKMTLDRHFKRLRCSMANVPNNFIESLQEGVDYLRQSQVHKRCSTSSNFMY